MQVNLSVALKRRYEMEEEASHLRSQLFEAHDSERMVGGGQRERFSRHSLWRTLRRKRRQILN